jgi:hydrogenase expression/formation protein HypE
MKTGSWTCSKKAIIGIINMKHDRILLSHGSGGSLMHSLIKDIFLRKFNNPVLNQLADAATLVLKGEVAFTTDSFVVSPLFFPGADIGKLAVCGTVNDLVMAGAVPEYLSLGIIAEEGLKIAVLEKICDSIRSSAKKAGVRIVTGDFKVVEKGACDKIFINTSGVGRITGKSRMSAQMIEPGDKVIITGEIAQHGLAVLAKRKNIDLKLNIKSDCQELASMLVPVIKKTGAVRFMRDPTRGGLATTLNEIARSSRKGIFLDEKSIPVSSQVKTACDLLGIDPLYVANEGKAVLIVENKKSGRVLAMLKKHPFGKRCAVIGSVSGNFKGRVILNTPVGTQRMVDMLSGEQLPRIC